MRRVGSILRMTHKKASLPLINTALAEPSQLLTTVEASAFLRIGKRTLQELAAERRIAQVKFGRNVRYLRADLIEFANKNRVAAAGWKMEGAR